MFAAVVELLLFLVVLGIFLARFRKQRIQLRALERELHGLRQEVTGRLDIDPLTGLLNQAAMGRWLDEDKTFAGLVVVCDLDDFKALNDRFGHLVGDEVLRGMGQIVRTSIREEDLAFRWGGDEFVICFRAELDADSTKLVEDRMQNLQERLKRFQIRHHGPLIIGFSWGASASVGRPLRETLAEADRRMYEAKHQRSMQMRMPGL